MRKFFTVLVGTISALLVAVSASANQAAYVNCDVLNVRVSPNTDCEIVTKLYCGNSVEIVYTENGWYNIRLANGATGFVSAQYLTEGNAPFASETGSNIAAKVQGFIGLPYVYGASGPGSFDCSGLTSYMYKQFGYSIPRTASAQAGVGSYIEQSALQAGDLVFFSNRSDRRINHVGIYIGDNKFVHAANSNRGVVKDDLTSKYYSSHYVTARRIV